MLFWKIWTGRPDLVLLVLFLVLLLVIHDGLSFDVCLQMSSSSVGQQM